MIARRSGLLAALLSVVLAVTACGSSSSSSTSSPSSGAATTSTATSTTTTAGSVTTGTGAGSGRGPIGISGAAPAGSFHGTTLVHRLGGVPGHRATVALIGHLPRQHRPIVHAHLQGLTGSLTDKLTTGADSVARNWARLFSQAGGSLPSASVALVGDQPTSCGSTQVSASSSPEYCPATATVQIPLGFVGARVAPLGDAALLLLVSNLYGYHVENALGMLRGGNSIAQLERVDACLSGVYFLTVYGSLQQADEQSVSQLLSLSAGGGVTADDLTSAFNAGLVVSGGDYRACLKPGI